MAITTATVAEAETSDNLEGTSRFAWLRAFRRPWTLTGIVIVLIFLVLAIIGPWISPYDPSAVSKAALQPPSPEHWLGTTQTGQDILSQMLYGTQVSMIVGVCAAIVATVLS